MPQGKSLGSAVASPSGKARSSVVKTTLAPAATFDTAKFDALNAEKATAFIQDSAERDAVLAYERKNKNRSTVLSAFEGES